MEFQKTAFKDLIICTPKVFEDDRGYFYESFNAKAFHSFAGFEPEFVQDNQSQSTYGVLRGLHFQIGEFAQSKLVRVVAGEVLDVVVDLRKNEPTYKKAYSIHLSAENKKQLFVPKGMAHGFVTLSDTATFIYKCDNYYNKESERGLAYNDPSLQIDWLLDKQDVILSEKDKENTMLADLPSNLFLMSTLSRNIRLLITGGGGQVAQAINEEEATFENVTSIHLSKSELDITSTSSIKKAIDLHQPDVIINTAAYTAVDAAEEDKEKAFLVNEIGVKNLAQACKDNGIKLIHISTDYVFDGEKPEEYTEEDIPNPTTVYGKSKLAGEQAIINSGLLDYAIIRTSWVYSVYGSNFVKTMLRLGNVKDEISVVNDQYGSPTLANNLASVILQLSNVLTIQNAGVYHYTNEGVTTWYAFAKAVFSYKKMSINVLPVSSDRFVTKATRPKNSKLESSKIITLLGIENVPWEESLEKMLVKL